MLDHSAILRGAEAIRRLPVQFRLCSTYTTSHSGRRIRTSDLLVMSQPSYLTAPSRDSVGQESNLILPGYEPRRDCRPKSPTSPSHKTITPRPL
jgi:hypothetical protein